MPIRKNALACGHEFPERWTISRNHILAHISLIVPNCLVGANDDVAIPIGMLKIDWRQRSRSSAELRRLAGLGGIGRRDRKLIGGGKRCACDP